MQTIRSRSIAALGAVIATVTSIAGVAPAHAATSADVAADEAQQVTVSLRGVALSTPEGKAMIDRRIRYAARQVCGPVTHEMSVKVIACRRAAIADARLRLNAHAAQQLAAR